MELKEKLQAIYNNLDNSDLKEGIDIDDLLKCQDVDDVSDYLDDCIKNCIYNLEFIDDAIEYLQDNDPSLEESVELLKELDYKIEDVNSYLLANTLKQENIRGELQDCKDAILEELKEFEEGKDD